MTTREMILKELDDILAIIDNINDTLSRIIESEKNNG